MGDREGEAAALEAQADETEARAESLASFVTFQQIHDARVQTVDSLARSRFDWERVMRELAKVLPEVRLADQPDRDGGPRHRGRATRRTSRCGRACPGPALELIGCGRSQRDVARLVAALEDIDGVTRVTAQESIKSGTDTAAASTDAESATDECRTRPTIPKFKIVASFDEVVPADGRPRPGPRRPGARHRAAPTAEQVDRWQDGRAGRRRGHQPGAGRLT